MDNEIKKAEPQQIQRVEIPADAPLLTRMAMMMENGVKIDVDQMSKMYELSERVSAGEAKKAFAADFTVAQAGIEAVVKGKWNPQTKSHYADLSSVIAMTKPVYTEANFSVTFYEGVTEVAGHIRVCADVLHADGHSKPYHYDVPLGGVGIAGKVNMTAIHAKATSVTYGQRYLMTMIWNIPTQDTDGNPPPKPQTPKVRSVSPTEKDLINDICDNLPDKPGFQKNVTLITEICLVPATRDHLVPEKVVSIAKYLITGPDKDKIYIADGYGDFDSEPEIPGSFEEPDAS
jgi:hypothetical protein